MRASQFPRGGRGRGRGKFIVIVLPTFAGLKVTYNVLDLKITKKKKKKKKKKGSEKEVCMVQNESEHLSLVTNR